MSNLEHEKFVEVASAMSDEEKMIILQQASDDMLIVELARRLVAFDTLKEAVRGIQAHVE